MTAGSDGRVRSMDGSCWFAKGVLAVAIAASLAGCGRPEGDFGRAKPSVLHDDILPAIGKRMAAKRGEAVGNFNLTDTEQELQNRAWTLIRAPHQGMWWQSTLIEGERTRVLPPFSGAYAPGDYYRELSSDRYASSDTRWSRVIADMAADEALLPPYCATVVKVWRIDGERIAAIGREMPADDEWAKNAGARVAENDNLIGWVSRSLQYRLDSYAFAIDHLAIETPSDEEGEARRGWAALRKAALCPGVPAAAIRRPAPVRKGRALDGFYRPVDQK
ncbi:hypothetical protein HDIA_1329 [Hartmannibacter diazotrophicus]|uniref:Uncharacterized protein n=1 Tax=Hartmannibacter diazotrophicus TaxID=1482074 RepID=A0A2C9D3N2_9HYPH|nr:hypothetical protein [Hartmannibacter diazotrophicus]SON54870.1 hypothetical protein HDIA_1329 [Hartmannibacter diazotrophicus]